MILRIALTAALCAAPLAVHANDTQHIVSVDTIYITFDQDNGGDSGSQILIPVAYSYESPSLDLGIATSFVENERDSSITGRDGKISTISDTALSASWRAFSGNVGFLGDRRVSLSLNTNVNLPTGQSKLDLNERNADFTSLLVDQSSFGAGFNVGLGFTAAIIPIDNTLVSVGAAYNYLGEYEIFGLPNDQDFDPGDQFILSTMLARQFNGGQWHLGYRFVERTPNKTNGVETFEQALFHIFTGSFAYDLSEDWTIRGTGIFSTRGADAFLDSSFGALRRSSFDNTGDTFSLALGVTHQATDRDRIGFDVRHIAEDANDFPTTSARFRPERSRNEATLTYEHVFDDVTLIGSATYFDLDQGDRATVQGEDFSGFRFRLGAVYAF